MPPRRASPGLPGLQPSVVRDETGNPFSRVIIAVDPARAGLSAHGLARALGRGEPRILLRSLYADRGILQMDVRRMDDATLELVCGRIAEALRAPGQETRRRRPCRPVRRFVRPGWHGGRVGSSCPRLLPHRAKAGSGDRRGPSVWPWIPLSRE